MISSDATRRRCVTGAAWAALAALLACPIALGSGRGNDVPTYAGEIASILHGRCASCHRPLGAGPFDLLTYEDARKRANQIVDVISSGYMPPWQPDPPEEPTGFEFVGSRRMPDDEIEMIRAWARNDTPRGKKSAEPPPPEFEDGWLLGAPDLVVEVGDGYVLPAEGGDVIRNFVTAIPVEARRWVKTVELRPGNQRVVHHAVLSVDRSRVSRQLDARDPEPGFGGLDMGFAGLPGGHTVIWAPGSVPDPGIDEMAWALDPGGDLVLQLHMVPTGKDETVGMKVGFHFATRPPTIQAVQLMLRNDLIDIPAGLDDYVLQDSLELPVAVDLLAVCPHAHYLGKRIEVLAILPNLERRSLITIPDWDFNWQQIYRYRQPVSLPAGTTLVMRYTYDNSAENDRNPHLPPKRVVGGNDSADEMANLLLQVVPKDPDDVPELVASQFLKLVRRNPRDSIAHYNLGVIYANQGALAAAAGHYEAALTISPDNRDASYGLAGVYARMGRFDRAADQYRRTLALAPEFTEARYMLGVALIDLFRHQEAANQFAEVIAQDPGHARAHYRYGMLLAGGGRPELAETHLRRALELAPEMDEARAALKRLNRTPPP